jgi:hypothetical protein
MAIGSLVEAKCSTKIALKLKFVDKEMFDKLMPKFDELFFKLLALRKSLHE